MAGSAGAHDADILYAQRGASDAGGPEVRERLTLTAGTLGLLLPADADGDGAVTQAELDARRAALEVGIWDACRSPPEGQPCTRQAHAARVRETYVELAATFCVRPGPLRQTFTVLSVLPANYRVVLGSLHGRGGRGSSSRTPPSPSVDCPRADGASLARRSGCRGWVGLGVKHIFEGSRSPRLPAGPAAGGRAASAGAAAW